MKTLLRRFSRKAAAKTPSLASLRQQRIAELRTKLPDANEPLCGLIASVEHLTMTSPERILAACRAIEYVCENNIAGDVVECGVWRGGSMVAMAQTLIGCEPSTKSPHRSLWLYDTFDGMSQPTGQDVDFLGRTAENLLSNDDKDDPQGVWCVSPIEQVRDVMQATGYPEDQIQLVRGKVEDTLPSSTLPDQIAILRLDTDWYESTRCELEHLFPRLVNGGVLIIDDYGHWEGCRRAVDEYLSKLDFPVFLNRIDYTGRLAVIQRAV